jgi:cytochrome d ubiquinol oxidase subunit II
LPLIGLLALAAITFGVRGKRDQLSFLLNALFCLATFLGLRVMLRPCMISYSITVGNASAHDASSQFPFYGAIVVLPIILAYTIGVYWAFRGRLHKGEISLH